MLGFVDEYPAVQLDPERQLEEIVAVWNKEIIGDYYADDETWASTASLAAWQAQHLSVLTS